MPARQGDRELSDQQIGGSQPQLMQKNASAARPLLAAPGHNPTGRRTTCGLNARGGFDDDGPEPLNVLVDLEEHIRVLRAAQAVQEESTN